MGWMMVTRAELGFCARDGCPYGTPCTVRDCQELIALVPTPALSVCLRDERVVWVNPAFGAEADEILNRLIEELVADEDRPRVRSVLTTATEDEGAAGRVSVRCRLRPHTVQLTVTALREGDGSRRQALVFTDQPAGGDPGVRVAELERTLTNIARELTWSGLIEGTRVRRAAIPNVHLLNEREREVIDLFAAGMRVASIAERLFVSPSTVRNYFSAIYRKLGVGSQAELSELLLRDHRPLSAN
jgi:DNA-binding CsgD family transcriptional regulator